MLNEGEPAMTAAQMTIITGTHPYADKFPMLPEPELKELAQSIGENGLRSPIVLTPDGLILDGRNRARACEIAGIEPDTVTYDGDDLAEYVIDANITRRNMSTGARAMATALVLEADGRRQENGRWKRGSVDIVESHNSETWRDALKRAGIILDFKPDIADAVVAGDLALDAAYQQAEAIRTSAEWDKIMEKERQKREKTEAEAVAQTNARIIADLTMAGSKFAALIEDGKMTPSEAWAAHLEQTRKDREQAAELRRNDQRRIRHMCSALDAIDLLEVPNNRAWTIRAAREHPGEVNQKFFTPEAIRSIAGWLLTFADELENDNARG